MSVIKRVLGHKKLKEVISWSLYDFANSSYGLIVLAFVFPIFFKDIVAGAKYGDFIWGLIGGLSILIAGVSAPILGAAIDHGKFKKKAFITCVLLAIVGTSLLYFSNHSLFFVVCIVFIVTNAVYDLSLTLYDSFLPDVSNSKNAGLVSGLGYGLGYLGGIVALLVFRPFYENGYLGSFSESYRLTFPLTALFFLIFSIPLFIFVKNTDRKKDKTSLIDYFKIGFKNVGKTFRDIKKHKHVGLFIIGFYFMTDVLFTIFAFIAIYGSTTFSMSVAQIAFIFLIVQIVAVPSSFVLGVLSDKIGYKKVVIGSLVVWCFVIILLAMARTYTTFYLVAVLSGLVIGGSQAVARSWLSALIPEKKRTEFFGFNSLSSKISGTIGPVIFGAISSFTGNQRLAMITLLPFLIVSILIFIRIPEKKH